MKTTNRCPWILLGALMLLPAQACKGGNGASDDAAEDAVEVPEQFTLYIELIPAVGYDPALDANTITITVGTTPPVVFEGLEIPRTGPYLYSFEMEPLQAAEVAAVRADGWRTGVETLISTGRCSPVRLGDWTTDPVTGVPKPLKLFFHKMDTFSLMPDGSAMAFGRVGHRAAVLSDGGIVVLGGATASGLTRIIERFDLPTLTFSPVATELPATRSEFAMIETGANEWLLVGGRTDQTVAHRMTEVAGVLSFETVPLPEQLLGIWAAPRVAALSDGTFVLGGADTGPGIASALYVRYDRVAGFSILSFMLDGSPVEPDKYHPTLTPIDTAAGQRVLLYGGGGALPPAAVLDPATGELSDGEQTILDTRYDHGAAAFTMRSEDGTMENQAVWILGGEEKIDETTTQMAQFLYLFVPACLGGGACIVTAPWANAGPAFTDHPAKSAAVAALAGGRVLYIGGRDGAGQAVGEAVSIRAENPRDFSILTLPLGAARVAPEVLWYEATGQLFIIGGEGDGGAPLASMEVFTPREP
jgi:hypothetical protein